MALNKQNKLFKGVSLRMLFLMRKIDKYTKELDNLKSSIIEEMKNNNIDLIDNELLKVKLILEHNQERLNTKLLQEENQELYNKYLMTTSIKDFIKVTIK